MINYDPGVRASVGGVPQQWLQMLQQVNYETGCPMSWLAAVCEAAGWDPNLQLMNWSESPPSPRRLGLAGIWCKLSDVRIDTNTHAISYQGNTYAGWMNGGLWAANYPGCCPSELGPLLGTGIAGILCQPNVPVALDPLQNLRAAARLLLNLCVPAIQQICGGLNGLIFLKWQLGCYWLPSIKDGVCWIPPDVPQWTLTEMDNTWSYQIQYAQIFNEPPIGVPLAVTITADMINVNPGDTITFQAHTTGGNAPYTFTFNFGDGSPVNTQNAVAQHTYSTKGVYQAFVEVRDNLGMMAASSPISIGVGIPVPPPPGGGNGWLLAGLVGLVGLAGLIGLAKRQTPEGKRQQAAALRAEASRLRTEAASLRAQGKTAEAQQKELQASDLEQRATELEREAQQEETARLYQQGQPSGSQKIVR